MSEIVVRRIGPWSKKRKAISLSAVVGAVGAVVAVLVGTKDLGVADAVRAVAQVPSKAEIESLRAEQDIAHARIGQDVKDADDKLTKRLDDDTRYIRGRLDKIYEMMIRERHRGR